MFPACCSVFVPTAPRLPSNSSPVQPSSPNRGGGRAGYFYMSSSPSTCLLRSPLFAMITSCRPANRYRNVSFLVVYGSFTIVNIFQMVRRGLILRHSSPYQKYYLPTERNRHQHTTTVKVSNDKPYKKKIKHYMPIQP